LRYLRGTARGDVAAPSSACVDVLLDVESYKHWYPSVVRSADVRERGPDGVPVHASVVLHIAIGPFSKDLPFELSVTRPGEGRVTLSRLSQHPGDEESFELRWEVSPGSLSVELDANLAVPRLVPTGGIGDAMAASLVRRATREIESRAGAAG
jgi:hypothetical protein